MLIRLVTLRYIHNSHSARPSLLLALVWRLLAAVNRHQQVQVIAFPTETTMKLRLIEQACSGCSKVQNRGGLKVRARLWLALGWTVLASANRNLQVLAFAVEPQ